MKKLIYYIIIATITWSMGACNRFEDPVFDGSSAQRINEAIANYDRILNSAPNGWALDYYAGDTEDKIGGYRMLVNFNNGAIEMMAAHKLGDVLPKMRIKSSYSFKRDKGPVLSFDSYNSIIHFFAEPKSTDLDGLGGDFEFVMTDVSPEKIVMVGKRNRLRAIMRPIDANLDWEDYIDNTLAMQTKISQLLRFTIQRDGQYIGMSNLDQNDLFITEEEKPFDEAYTLTNNGFSLYKPITIGRQEVENFTFNAQNNSFSSTENGSKIMLIPESVSYEDFLGNYTLSYVGTKGANSDDVQIKAKEIGKSYTLSSPTFINDLEMYYDNGKLSIRSMNIGPMPLPNTNSLWIHLGSSTLNIYNSTARNQLYSKWTKGLKDKMRLELVSDNVIDLIIIMGAIDGIALKEQRNSTVIGNVYNAKNNTTFTKLVLTKK